MLTLSSNIQQKPLHFGEITKLSHDGRGIAVINGKVTFLHGGLPGEHIEFFYLKKHAKYDEGQVVTVSQPSPDRVEPICAHYGVCGGCSLQHLAPTQQIAMKQGMLLEQFAFMGGVTPDTVLPPLTDATQGYRYKARLGVKYVHAKNKVLVGFRERNGRYVADINHCPILHASVGEKLGLLSALVHSLEAYQTIPQIEVAVSDTATALIFRHLEPLSAEDLNKLIAFARTENMHFYLQPGGPKTIHLLYPEDPEGSHQGLLHYALPEQNLTLRFHPSHFTQVNPAINRKMIARAIELLQPELLQPQAHERILDLFCGIGNFTLPLAQHCAAVVGVEGDAELVQRARQNAADNGIYNAEFYATDLAGDFSKQTWAQTTFDKILLDPPRTGALEIVSTIGQFKAKKILYVSCNPATLARDAKALAQQGYRLTQAGVMDMFTHTSHVESIALFERAK
jgi:23S rRNA (uracil1939-C5)-methyltransferase